MEYLFIALGGALGSFTRYTIGKKITEKKMSTFPIATFIINITGAILLGIVTSIGFDTYKYALFGDGFLGAYTTFSTFMYEGFTLFQNNEKLNAAIYILFSFILGIIGYIIGVEIYKWISIA
jgi:CrcB protein